MKLTKVLKTRLYKDRGYIVIDELISIPGNPDMTLKSSYSWPDLYYIGTSNTAYRRWKMNGVTEFYPYHDYKPMKELSDKDKIKKFLKGESILQLKNSPCCLIGWSPRDQKWYGWARAIWGFGIGSFVKKDDIAYRPSNKEDFIENTLRFWDFNRDGSWIDHHNESIDNIISKRLISLEEDVLDPYGDFNGLGILLKYETDVKDDRDTLSSQIFKPYPDQWGKGEWTAETLEDARQMACDFAGGCA